MIAPIQQCTIIAHNTAENTTHNLPSYSSKKYHRTAVVYWRAGGPNIDWLNISNYKFSLAIMISILKEKPRRKYYQPTTISFCLNDPFSVLKLTTIEAGHSKLQIFWGKSLSLMDVEGPFNTDMLQENERTATMDAGKYGNRGHLSLRNRQN